MAVLTSQQRAKLENAVIKARNYAESGAIKALSNFAVNTVSPFSHMTAEQRKLRNRLRNKARLLGDILLPNGEQKIEKLSYEFAYEYWHKMLFAKFLEANDLLIHPDGVPVTLNECEELAKEEGFEDKWSAASFYASKMLPAIFRVDDPLMKIEFATEDRVKLESLLDNIEDEIFKAEDALGWVYQFWQNESKIKINKSGDKIDGEKLPAVTQLFTEPYMVQFLIDNTLGAWWVSRNPEKNPPVNFEYLRYNDEGKPAAGNFEGMPNKTAEITALDPCMGSGHFIVSLFNVLVNLRMFEENLNKDEATDKVIKENIHGLEIDPRCTQIAAFNLALAAWKFCGYYKLLPEMNLACSGIAPKGKKEDWVKLASKIKDPAQKEKMENGMEAIYDHFQLAPELGSLLDPTTIKENVLTASFEELLPLLTKALNSEEDEEQLEIGVFAAGIAKAGKLLTKKYNLQITNVPYLSRGKQSFILNKYCEENYKNSKSELATVFLEKMLKNNSTNSITCCVLPQNWLFLKSYKTLRENLLRRTRIKFLVKLGAQAFSQISGEVVKVILIILEKNNASVHNTTSLIDVSSHSSTTQKANNLRTEDIIYVNQIKQLNNPDACITFELLDYKPLLGKYASCLQGISLSDRMRLIKGFWEFNQVPVEWEFLQSSFKKNGNYLGCNFIIPIKFFKENIKEIKGAMRGETAFGKLGISVSKMSNLKVSLYCKKLFDGNAHVILAKNFDYLLPIWTFCNNKDFNKLVREIDSKLDVTNSSIEKVPFDLDYWQKVADEKYPNGLPKPYSDDPTQWLYHGNPKKSDNPLQVALARLLGYKWPAESDKKMELADEAKALINEIKYFDNLADEDGIVCLPSVNGELSAAERLRNYLQAVFGSDWSNTLLEQFLTKEKAKKTTLDEWLREEYFEQHCKVFNNRPFIWHIWDGRKDGFGVLVNYHKLTKENLQKLIYTYLGDWIRQCETKKRSGESGAEGLLSAALQLDEKLKSILIGENPYDIFVRWKPLEKQPIGWEPDLNDGVRLNIRPFIIANVLRKKPNIKWGIDRGKNPKNAPWGEIRDNDIHLSLEEKKKSRKP